MRYFVDFEFTRFEGEIISVGIVSQTGKELYLALSDRALRVEQNQGLVDPWVAKNVIPFIDTDGAVASRSDERSDIKNAWPHRIYQFMLDTQDGINYPVQFVTDWWEDTKLMAGLMITGPGTCVNVPQANFSVVRVDSYPTKLAGAVQHNALWDARALKDVLKYND